tara:strand:- start:2447 stop:3067 length:621 start_codon:yes stop_codon:yes gene_type:complete
MIEIVKTPIFTHEVFSFRLPNFENYKKQIEQIILVEDNKSIHKIDTSISLEDNVKAKRTAWNSHQKYQPLKNICDDISIYIQEFIYKEDYDIPYLELEECWINWYGKGQNAVPHHHGPSLSVVLFVDVEDTDASFYFHANKNLVLHKKSDVKTNFNNHVEVKAKNGTVLFFDGRTMHSVSPNLKNKTRVTMAMNFKAVYTEKRNEY